jgi:hypothetical protein
MFELKVKGSFPIFVVSPKTNEKGGTHDLPKAYRKAAQFERTPCRRFQVQAQRAGLTPLGEAL